MHYILKNKIGHINDGFEVERPLDDETKKLIEKEYNQDWKPTKDGTQMCNS